MTFHPSGHLSCYIMKLFSPSNNPGMWKSEGQKCQEQETLKQDHKEE